MTPEQARDLARMLKTARQERGLSAREVAKRSGMNDSNVVRLEQGAILNPRPETLKSLADVLDLDLADVYATIGYVQPEGLPNFTPYLRTKYSDLPPRARRELERSFTDIVKRYGYDPSGPKPGEDEH